MQSEDWAVPHQRTRQSFLILWQREHHVRLNVGIHMRVWSNSFSTFISPYKQHSSSNPAGVRIPTGTTNFSPLQTVRPALEPTQPPIRWAARSFSMRQSGRGVKLTIHLHLVRTFRMTEAAACIHSVERDRFTVYSPINVAPFKVVSVRHGTASPTDTSPFKAIREMHCMALAQWVLWVCLNHSDTIQCPSLYCHLEFWGVRQTP